MLNEIVYTLKNQNYTEILKALEGVSLPVEISQKLQTILHDHKSITEAVQAAIRKQLKDAFGLFASHPVHLFPSPPVFDPPPQKDPPPSNESPPAPASDEELENRAKNKTSNPPRKIAHKLAANSLLCPCCGKNMHRAHKKIVTIIRVQGFHEERNEIETARCLTCNTSTEAACPQAQEKTLGRFEINAAAVLIALRYSLGMPSFRLEEVTTSLGFRVPDSTQWELFETAADNLRDFAVYLKKTASQAEIVQMDDTKARINEITTQFKLRKNGSIEALKSDRTGVHTTGFIAKFPAGKICLFASGLHHAGEYFEKIMQARTTEEQLVLMVDASSSNTCKIKNLNFQVIEANCNSHAFRKFKDLKENPIFEQHIAEIMAIYRDIFALDKELKDLHPNARLDEHRARSLPRMEKIKEKIERDFINCVVEPNSELGRVYNYFINHYKELIAFCNIKGAPVCNNETERILKRAIRHRKNSLFFKNLVGSAVGDIHMTILLTAKENNIDPVKYVAALLFYEKERKENPEAFLPWNFDKTLQNLMASQTPVLPIL
jgi:transposase